MFLGNHKELFGDCNFFLHNNSDSLLNLQFDSDKFEKVFFFFSGKTKTNKKFEYLSKVRSFRRQIC